FGPSLAEQERAALQEAHPGWPPELVELVAQGEVSLALAEAHYPDWSVEQLRLVSQGRVVPGMSPAMVAAAWGAPDEIQEVTDTQLGPVLRWRYIETVGQYDFCTGTPRFWEEVRRTVLVRDGVGGRVEQGPDPRGRPPPARGCLGRQQVKEPTGRLKGFPLAEEGLPRTFEARHWRALFIGQEQES